MKFCVAFLAPVCLHLHYRTPLGTLPSYMLLFPLISLSSAEGRQDKVHQGFYFKPTSAEDFCYSLLDQVQPRRVMFSPPDWKPIPRLFKSPRDTQLESKTMCLIHRIAREPVKPP